VYLNGTALLFGLGNELPHAPRRMNADWAVACVPYAEHGGKGKEGRTQRADAGRHSMAWEGEGDAMACVQGTIYMYDVLIS